LVILLIAHARWRTERAHLLRRRPAVRPGGVLHRHLLLLLRIRGAPRFV
jgi:hypothetical protein